LKGEEETVSKVSYNGPIAGNARGAIHRGFLNMKPKYILALSSLIVATVIGSLIYDTIVRPGGSSMINQFLFASPWKIGALIAAVLTAHFLEPKAHLSSGLLAALPAFFGILAFFEVENVGRRDAEVLMASLLLLMYAASLFVILSDILLAGGAAYLTKTRGERWVKEMDYVYLSLGALGVFGTLNRLDILRGPILNDEKIGLAILAMAIVVRLLKTRAEVGGWNKLQTNNEIVSSAPNSSDALSLAAPQSDPKPEVDPRPCGPTVPQG
jgi:hypothetical protein